jgi:hypothetical protein
MEWGASNTAAFREFSKKNYRIMYIVQYNENTLTVSALLLKIFEKKNAHKYVIFHF